MNTIDLARSPQPRPSPSKSPRGMFSATPRTQNKQTWVTVHRGDPSRAPRPPTLREATESDLVQVTCMLRRCKRAIDETKCLLKSLEAVSQEHARASRLGAQKAMWKTAQRAVQLSSMTGVRVSANKTLESDCLEVGLRILSNHTGRHENWQSLMLADLRPELVPAPMPQMIGPPPLPIDDAVKPLEDGPTEKSDFSSAARAANSEQGNFSEFSDLSLASRLPATVPEDDSEEEVSSEKMEDLTKPRPYEAGRGYAESNEDEMSACWDADVARQMKLEDGLAESLGTTIEVDDVTLKAGTAATTMSGDIEPPSLRKLRAAGFEVGREAD